MLVIVIVCVLIPPAAKKNYALVQAEDELAAIGITIGAGWNGARAFTATSGPGISLMTEFLGLAYFAEIPMVLINVQRAGPSTGMPTRTQQSDILACAYASHGDTKHILLFPQDPTECFEFSALAFDLTDKLQTPVIIMSDLDLGMNDHLTDEFNWDDEKKYDLGKVLSAKQLDEIEQYGRYLDTDGDGICYRTLPGTDPSKGAFFTRGTSRNIYATYTEKSTDYVDNMQRLTKKFISASKILPEPEIIQSNKLAKIGLIYFGTSAHAISEALDQLKEHGLSADTCRIKAFPFNQKLQLFIDQHEYVYVIEQNRDAQMRTVISSELNIDPARLFAITNYDGLPITSRFIVNNILIF